MRLHTIIIELSRTGSYDTPVYSVQSSTLHDYLQLFNVFRIIIIIIIIIIISCCVFPDVKQVPLPNIFVFVQLPKRPKNNKLKTLK